MLSRTFVEHGNLLAIHVTNLTLASQTHGVQSGSPIKMAFRLNRGDRVHIFWPATIRYLINSSVSAATGHINSLSTAPAQRPLQESEQLNLEKVAAGIISSLVCWAVACWLMLATMMGDCIPGSGVVCPTDHERKATVLTIFIAALGVNAFVIFLIRRERSRRRD